MEIDKPLLVGKAAWIGCAQVGLHLRIDHARCQRNDARRIGQTCFIERDHAACMIESAFAAQ